MAGAPRRGGFLARDGRSALVHVSLYDRPPQMNVETLIIGGGPAGAACAAHLADAGHEVMLIERTSAPHHKVCGEFISIETQAALARLGIDAAALGAAAIEDVSIYAGRKSVRARIPFRALSLSR